MRMITAVTAAAVWATLVSNAIAGTGEEVPQRTVSFADLELSRPGDVKRLERRVARAARAVCGIELPLQTQAQSRCLRAAMERSSGSIELAVRKAGGAYAGGRLREADAAER